MVIQPLFNAFQRNWGRGTCHYIFALEIERQASVSSFKFQVSGAHETGSKKRTDPEGFTELIHLMFNF